jgi:hypothetical protein
MALLPVYNHVFMALPVNQNIPQRFSHFSLEQASGWFDKTKEEALAKKGLAAGWKWGDLAFLTLMSSSLAFNKI